MKFCSNLTFLVLFITETVGCQPQAHAGRDLEVTTETSAGLPTSDHPHSAETAPGPVASSAATSTLDGPAAAGISHESIASGGSGAATPAATLSASITLPTIELPQAEVLRSAYLAKAAYFYLGPDTSEATIKPNEREILTYLRTHTETLIVIPVPGTPHTRVLGARVTRIDGTDELILSVRGTETLDDVFADISLNEIYESDRLKAAAEFHNQEMARLGFPRTILPKALESLLPASTCPEARTEHQAQLTSQRHWNTSKVAGSALLFLGGTATGGVAGLPIACVGGICMLWTGTQSLYHLATNYTKEVGHSITSQTCLKLNDKTIKGFIRPIGEAIQNYLQEEIRVGRPISKITFVGHSLGGFLAKVLAMNYDHQIGGFSRTLDATPLALPDHAFSFGFNPPGVSADDFYTLQTRMTGIRPVEIFPDHHFTLGHTQDLVHALGNITRAEGGELVQDTQGYAHLISLDRAWFHEDSAASNSSASSSTTGGLLGWCTAAVNTGAKYCSSATRGICEAVTGIGDRNLRPHGMSALIDSLKREIEHLGDRPLVFTLSFQP